MPYGIIKVDQVTFTNAGVDQTISVSGIVASISGNITATGTISGDVIRGGTLVSGATVTGTAGQFGTITGNTAGFTTVTGTTVTGTTATFTSGVFTNISGGTHTITSGVFASGTAANPSITFQGDVNTGIYSPDADQVAISTNGSGRLFVDASGNVGINTASTIAPGGFGYTREFALTGATSGDSSAAINIRGSRTVSGGFGDINFWHQSTSNRAYIQARRGSSDSAIDLDFITSGGAGMRITSAGLVGIGTSTVGAQLEVLRTSTTDPSLRLRYNATSYYGDHLMDGNGNYIIYSPAANGVTSGNLRLRAGGSFSVSTNDQVATSPALTIDTSGRLGIGTTSPDFDFQVGATGSGGVAINKSAGAVHGTFGSGGNLTIRAQLVATAGGGQIFLGGSTRGDGDVNAIIFSNANTERARIDSSGRLLVGTSSGVTGTSVQIQGSSASSAGGAVLYMQRGQGAGSITSGDTLGRIYFASNTGGVYAGIEAQTDGAGAESPADYPGRLVFSTTADGASSPTERMRIRQDGIILVGKTGQYSDNTSAVGIDLQPGGTVACIRSGEIGLLINRTTSDGDLVSFRQDGTQEGTISVSGSTVSYNGAHLSRWSQLPSGADRIEILRGSVLSNLDEMCEWGEEDNEQLNRMKVSDVEGDKNVSGVFQAWDDDDDTYTNDFYCAMTGDFIIRIAADVTVERGDLLMSAGDGTAKPQGDGYVQDKTIAKVTSTNVSCTYDDGSYCVPCVLMAC